MFLCEEISTSQCTLEVGSTRLSNDETRRRKNRFPPATIFLRSATPAGDRQRRAGNVKSKGVNPSAPPRPEELPRMADPEEQRTREGILNELVADPESHFGEYTNRFGNG